jgi:hypothetical protein
MIELIIACVAVAAAVCAGYEMMWGASSFNHPEEAAKHIDTADNAFGLLIALVVVGLLLTVVFI